MQLIISSLVLMLIFPWLCCVSHDLVLGAYWLPSRLEVAMPTVGSPPPGSGGGGWGLALCIDVTPLHRKAWHHILWRHLSCILYTQQLYGRTAFGANDRWLCCSSLTPSSRSAHWHDVDECEKAVSIYVPFPGGSFTMVVCLCLYLANYTHYTGN